MSTPVPLNVRTSNNYRKKETKLGGKSKIP